MAQADPGPDPEAGLARLTELLAPFPAAAVRRAPEKGRFLVAAADLGHGETVLRGHSYATAVLGSHVKRVCAHCMEDFERRLEICCKDCQQVYYCSEACRERHRTGYRRQSGRSRSCVPHRLTCPVLGPFASGRFDTEMESVLRLLVDVYALRYLEEHVGDLDWEPTPLADGEGEAGARGEEEERLAGALGGLALANRAPVTFTHADFLDLQTHAADLSGPQKKEFVKPLRFLAKAFARAEGAWPGFTAPPKEEMVDWASRIDSNCFGLFLDKDHKREPELAGREVYLLASLMNHSCRPNCEIDVNRTHFELKAREAIPAGTELTISYIDCDKPVAARRKYLERNYFFACACQRCVEELQSGGKKTKYTYEASKGQKKKGKGGGRKGVHKKKMEAPRQSEADQVQAAALAAFRNMR